MRPFFEQADKPLAGDKYDNREQDLWSCGHQPYHRLIVKFLCIHARKMKKLCHYAGKCGFLWYIGNQMICMKSIAYVLVFALCIGKANAQQDKTKGSLNHLAIFVADLQRSVDFYSNVFHLDTIPEPFHDNKHKWYSIAPGVALHVIAGADKPKEYFLNNHMCFSVGSVDAFLEKIKARGIVYMNSRGDKGMVTTRVDGVKQIWINDPDGYFIEVNDAKN